jgi:hypothetical protein
MRCVFYFIIEGQKQIMRQRMYPASCTCVASPPPYHPAFCDVHAYHSYNLPPMSGPHFLSCKVCPDWFTMSIAINRYGLSAYALQTNLKIPFPVMCYLLPMPGLLIHIQQPVLTGLMYYTNCVCSPGSAST